MLATASLENASALTAGVTYFDPEEYLVNILRRAEANQQDILVRCALGEVKVLGTRKEYFAQVEVVKDFCRAPLHQFAVEVLKPGDPRRPDVTQKGRDLAELIWKAAFYASEGRLMDGCYRDDVVQLVRWPNLSRLPTTPNTVRICALLNRYPTSITLASRLLKIDLHELYQIYSAAKCAGVAHALNRKPAEPVLAPHRNRGLLSLLLGKIGGS